MKSISRNGVTLSDDQKLRASEVLAEMATMNRRCMDLSNGFGNLISNATDTDLETAVMVCQKNYKFYNGFIESTSWDRDDLKKILVQIRSNYVALLQLVNSLERIFKSKAAEHALNQKKALDLFNEIDALAKALDGLLGVKISSNNSTQKKEGWVKRLFSWKKEAA